MGLMQLHSESLALRFLETQGGTPIDPADATGTRPDSYRAGSDLEKGISPRNIFPTWPVSHK